MSTFKARQKRVNSRCVCTPQANVKDKESRNDVMCRYGNCFEWRCRKCNGFLGGFGPVECPCDGAPRWMRHSAMAPGRVKYSRLSGAYNFIKPCITRRGRKKNSRKK